MPACLQLAVRFIEAHATLTGRGRRVQAERKFVRMVQAALKHPLRWVGGRVQLNSAVKLAVLRAAYSVAWPAWWHGASWAAGVHFGC